MSRCLVSLGANLGDPPKALDEAECGLRQLAEPGTLRLSERHATDPVGGPAGQGGFVNAAAVLSTALAPKRLLTELQRIESASGRSRGERWAARPLDLDLLLYDDAVLLDEKLRIPHPRMTFRPFMLAPACELAAEWRHPEANAPLGALYETLLHGRDAVAVWHDGSGIVADWVRALRPDVAIETRREADAPKLTIDASVARSGRMPAGPRLALADCPREHWRDEVAAALACVWPDST